MNIFYEHHFEGVSTKYIYLNPYNNLSFLIPHQEQISEYIVAHMYSPTLRKKMSH